MVCDICGCYTGCEKDKYAIGAWSMDSKWRSEGFAVCLCRGCWHNIRAPQFYEQAEMIASASNWKTGGACDGSCELETMEVGVWSRSNQRRFISHKTELCRKCFDNRHPADWMKQIALSMKRTGAITGQEPMAKDILDKRE